MPALKPIFDKIFNLGKGFSHPSDLENIPISNPVVDMQRPSGSFIDEHRMAQKDVWIHETGKTQLDEGSMSTLTDSEQVLAKTCP